MYTPPPAIVSYNVVTLPATLNTEATNSVRTCGPRQLPDAGRRQVHFLFPEVLGSPDQGGFEYAPRMLSAHPSALAKLDQELVGWLTTVNDAGQPQSSPVWHVTDGDDLIVYSRPNARRLVNLQSNPKVAYNLRGDPQGDTIVTTEGTAQADPTAPSPLGSPEYMAKYAKEMIRLGWTSEEYDQEFAIAIRITITRLRAT